MRSIILYIATSVDGYIARENGAVDWLFTEGDYGYESFYHSIDTTLMGNTTYQQVLTFGDFPYKDKINYVFSKSIAKDSDQNVIFIHENIVKFTKNLKNGDAGAIWLIGGSQIISQFLTAGLIDELIIFIHPIFLFAGIPLISTDTTSLGSKLHLLDLKKYETGIVQLHYEVL